MRRLVALLMVLAAIPASAQYIKPELKAYPAIFPPKDVAAKLEQLQDLTPAQRRLRSRMWTEIKAGK